MVVSVGYTFHLLVVISSALCLPCRVGAGVSCAGGRATTSLSLSMLQAPPPLPESTSLSAFPGRHPQIAHLRI